MKTGFTICLFVFLIYASFAQERTTSGKRQPATRPIQVSGEENPQNVAQLPKIELPEFVITGTAAIDPPDIQKAMVEEEGVYQRRPDESEPGRRERETIDLGNRFRQTMFAIEPRLNGTVGASFGSFSTTRLEGTFGQWTGLSDYLVSARYERTKGYVSNGESSGGGIGASGSLVTQNDVPIFNEMRVRGRFDLDAEKYRFFGSVSPTTTRNRTDIAGGVEVSSGMESPLMYQGALEYRTMAITDSTAEARENEVGFLASIQVPFQPVPLRARFEARLGTVTAGSVRNLSLVEIALESSQYTSGDFFASASLHGYAAKGMDGQSLGRLYPRLGFGYHLTEAHTALLSYEPKVEYASLRSVVQQNPYVSAQSVVRHPDGVLDLAGGLESQWSGWLRTRVMLRYQSIADYALSSDSAASGIWNYWYAGRTKMASMQLDVVANVGANDYFAGALVFLDAVNTALDGSVPYVPSFQGSALYRFTTSFDLVVSPRIGYIHSRRADVKSQQTVSGYLSSGVRAEYHGVPGWTFAADVQNILNARYEIWRGYRAAPFSVTVGASVRW